jgi:tetratricopeptide (TPR) repeat protein
MNEHKRYNEKLKRLLTIEELNIFKHDHYSLIDFGYDRVDTGEYKKAFELFRIGIKLNGYDPDILNGLRASTEVLKKAAELYPDDAVTLANLAGVYWELFEYEKAIFHYNRSLTLDPTISETHLNIVNLYYEFGDLFMAYITCMNYLSVRPDDKEAVELRDELILSLGIANF